MGGRILVTGAGGFIGSRVLDRFLRRTSFDGEVLGIVDPSRFAWHLVDLDFDRSSRVLVERATELDSTALREVLRRFEPDTLIHLAAVGVDPSTVDSPDNLRFNCELTLRLLADFIDRGGRRFVFAGSCFEYGRVSDAAPIPESHPCAPVTVYGRSKLMATEGVLDGAEKAGVEAVVLRPFHTYGPAENPNRMVAYLIRAAREGKVASLTRGEQVRDFVYVEDVADAFLGLPFSRCPSRGEYTMSPRARARLCVSLRIPWMLSSRAKPSGGGAIVSTPQTRSWPWWGRMIRFGPISDGLPRRI